MSTIKANTPYTEDETNYNGWSNFSTWKYATIFLNDEMLYNEFIQCIDADDLKALCIESGFDKELNINDVNFEELLEATRD